jgi:multidrug resistance protein, MATE family
MSTAAPLREARSLLVLGLPIVGGHLAQIAMHVTDTVMLGWYSVEALAAVVLASSLFFTLFLMGSGFALAVMPMVAAAAARSEDTEVRRVTRMALWLSMLYAVAVLPVLLLAEPILRATGQTPQVAADAGTYLRIAGWGMFPALLVMVLKSYLAALERTQVALWVTVAAAVANGLVNWAFIFGNWGAPELGIRGAALATVAAQVVSLSALLAYVVLVPALRRHALFVRLWRPDWSAFRSVYRLGWPIGLTSLAETGLFSASALMMGWVGTVPLAAHGIALQLASATFVVHLGLANATTVRAGQAHGRADLPGLRRTGGVSVALSMLFAGLTVAVFLAVPAPLIRLFLDPADPLAPQIVAVGIVLIALAALFQVADAAQVVALGLLRGVQDTRVPMVYAALSYWAVGIPCSYILGFPLGLGAVGIWLGLVVGLVLAGALLMARFWRGAARHPA